MEPVREDIWHKVFIGARYPNPYCSVFTDIGIDIQDSLGMPWFDAITIDIDSVLGL